MGSKNEFRGYFGQKAFTLVEMLICIAILAILISLLNPALRKGIETARVIVCTKNIEQIQATTVYYAEDYLILPPYYNDRVGFDEMLAGYSRHERVAL